MNAATTLSLAASGWDGQDVRYIFAGGEEDDNLSAMQVYDLRKKTWRSLRVGGSPDPPLSSSSSSSSPIRSSSRRAEEGQRRKEEKEGDELGRGDLLGGSVWSIECGTSCDKEMYIGGCFTYAGQSRETFPGFARFDVEKQAFSTVGGWTGPAKWTDRVKAVVAGNDNGYVYIGGVFTSVNGIPSNGVAAFNTMTQTWEDLSGRMEAKSYTDSLAFVQSTQTLYAGGYFHMEGTVWGLAMTQLGAAITPGPTPALISPAATMQPPEPVPVDPHHWEILAGGLASTVAGAQVKVNALLADDEEDVLYIGGTFDACNVSSDGWSETSDSATSLFLGNSTHSMRWQPLGRGLQASYGMGIVNTISKRLNLKPASSDGDSVATG